MVIRHVGPGKRPRVAQTAEHGRGGSPIRLPFGDVTPDLPYRVRTFVPGQRPEVAAPLVQVALGSIIHDSWPPLWIGSLLRLRLARPSRPSSAPRGRALAASADSTCAEGPLRTPPTRPRPCLPAAGGAAADTGYPPWSPATPTVQGRSRGHTRSAVWRRSGPRRRAQGCPAGSARTTHPPSRAPPPLQAGVI